MKIKVQGEANAQAVFDYFNGTGVRWATPTGKGDSWHLLVVNIPMHDYFATKFDVKEAFPKIRFSFK